MDERTLNKIPFLRVFIAFFNVASVLIVVFSVGLSAVALPRYWKNFRNATDSLERGYHAARFIQYWCYLYAVALIVVGAVWNGVWDWLPTISWLILLDPNLPHSDSVALDCWLSLALAVAAHLAAFFFGDESAVDGQYRRPDRHAAAEHIADVMERYRQILQQNPALDPRFEKIPQPIRNRQLFAYRERLAEMETRVRDVHNLYNRKSPI